MQWIKDIWLEYRIGMYYHLWMMSAGRRSMAYLDRMCALIRKRSPQQVSRMERNKGLA